MLAPLSITVPPSLIVRVLAVIAGASLTVVKSIVAACGPSLSEPSLTVKE